MSIVADSEREAQLAAIKQIPAGAYIETIARTEDPPMTADERKCLNLMLTAANLNQKVIDSL